MEIEQFNLNSVEMTIDGKLMNSRRISKKVQNNNLIVSIDFYGGVTEFILDNEGNLYQDGYLWKDWYSLTIEELKHFTSISNKETNIPVEITLTDFHKLLELFRDITDKEYHKDWHRYAREQLAKLGKLRIGTRYRRIISDLDIADAVVKEHYYSVILRLRAPGKRLAIELLDSDEIYFGDKQLIDCLAAASDEKSFARIAEKFNIFKGRTDNLALEEKDLKRVIICLADIILYRRGRKRRDESIDNFIMVEEIKAEHIKQVEERAKQEREAYLDEGKTKVDLDALVENEKPATISNKSIHVMLMMNILARVATGINYTNIEVIGDKLIEPLYKLGQSKQNKEVLDSLEAYENFYREHLMSTVNKMGEGTKAMQSF